MKRNIIAFSLLIFFISCQDNNPMNKEYDTIEIRQFKHVKEIPSQNDDSFDYEYIDSDLTEQEIEILIANLSSKGIVYYKSNKGQIFCNRSEFMKMGRMFLIDLEVKDSLKAKNSR